MFCRAALTSAGKNAAGGEQRCRAMGTGQFSPLFPPAAPGLVSLRGWERPGAGEPPDALSRGYVTLSPRQHAGCMAVAPNQETAPMRR